VLALAVPAIGQAATTETSRRRRASSRPAFGTRAGGTTPGGNVDTNDSYVVSGFHFFEDRTRNFFSFDLSSACAATSVTLQLTRFEQFDVPADVLSFPLNAAGVAAFNAARAGFFSIGGMSPL